MSENFHADELLTQHDAAEVQLAVRNLQTAIRTFTELRENDKDFYLKKNDLIAKRVEAVEKSLTTLITKVEFSVDRIAELRVRLNEFQVSESSAREARSQQIEASFGAGMTSLEHRLSNSSQQRHAALENRINETKFSLENRSNETKYGVEAKIAELKGSIDAQIKGQVIQGIVWGMGLCGVIAAVIFGAIRNGLIH